MVAKSPFGSCVCVRAGLFSRSAALSNPEKALEKVWPNTLAASKSGRVTALGRLTPSCGRNTKRKLKLQSLRLISWNVRTLTDRDNSSRPERRTALVAMELARYNIDVAALSETRLADEGQISETGAGYTFFWKGKTAEEPRLHGVGFAIRNSLVRMHNLLPVHVSERITTLRIPLQHGHVTIISVYAPIFGLRCCCEGILLRISSDYPLRCAPA